MKRLIAVILVFLLMVVSLAACADNSGQTNAPDASSTTKPPATALAQTTPPQQTQEPAAQGVVYPLEGNPTFTYAVTENAVISAICHYKDTPFMQKLQEVTGVTLEIEHPADFSLLFASGEYPDMISWAFNTYPGGYAKAIKDGVVSPVTDLMESCAPDYLDVLKRDEYYEKSATTPDGDVFGFMFIRGDKSLLTSAGMMCRLDWLNDLGLGVPETADELYEALLGFKTEKGATAPLSAQFSSYLFRYGITEGILTSPFGLVKGDFYHENGKVYYGYYQPGLKGVYQYLNKLYEEGLLDANFSTVDLATSNANIMGGVSGVTLGSLGGNMGSFLSTMAANDPDSGYDLCGVPSLVAKKGDTAFSGQYSDPLQGTAVVITTACKDRENAAKFANYAYSDEGSMLFNFGIEGESYEMINGYPTYTEYVMKNPDGLTLQQAQGQYMRAWVTDGFIQDKRCYEQTGTSTPQQKQALEVWINNTASNYKLPTLTISEANVSEYSKLMGDIGTYINEMAVKFISGIEPIDTGFDTYLSTLKSMGIERVIELQQEAYEEFISR